MFTIKSESLSVTLRPASRRNQPNTIGLSLFGKKATFALSEAERIANTLNDNYKLIAMVGRFNIQPA